jgi:hypothetical protein
MRYLIGTAMPVMGLYLIMSAWVGFIAYAVAWWFLGDTSLMTIGLMIGGFATGFTFARITREHWGQ